MASPADVLVPPSPATPSLSTGETLERLAAAAERIARVLERMAGINGTGWTVAVNIEKLYAQSQDPVPLPGGAWVLRAHAGAVVPPGETTRIPTGLHIGVPAGWYGVLFPHRDFPGSAPTILSDHQSNQGEIFIPVTNPSAVAVTVARGAWLATLTLHDCVEIQREQEQETTV